MERIFSTDLLVYVQDESPLYEVYQSLSHIIGFINSDAEHPEDDLDVFSIDQFLKHSYGELKGFNYRDKRYLIIRLSRRYTEVLTQDLEWILYAIDNYAKYLSENDLGMLRRILKKIKSKKIYQRRSIKVLIDQGIEGLTMKMSPVHEQ